ncbi:uncharacterized protein LOC113070255 [Carassius auratus]|uniref:Uncharacterized protein LOC113070255 n=1 Tax=Carassius auratus TaxID=7957 RepID=A0A6P6MRS1_CARAU|nr:uncharacterized protein LOC113070255 [Carassius auratus]
MPQSTASAPSGYEYVGPGATRTRYSQTPFTPAPGNHGPWAHLQWTTRARPWVTTSPPPVFEISTQKCFTPLPGTEPDAVIIGDSFVQQIPAILTADESPRVVMLHARVNDTMLRQMDTLKRDFRSLIEAMIIVSGPLPTCRRGHERLSRLFALDEWLLSWCKEQKLLFVNNWNLFWECPWLFRADGLHLTRVGAELLSDSISRRLRSI